MIKEFSKSPPAFDSCWAAKKQYNSTKLKASVEKEEWKWGVSFPVNINFSTANLRACGTFSSLGFRYFLFIAEAPPAQRT